MLERKKRTKKTYTNLKKMGFKGFQGVVAATPTAPYLLRCSRRGSMLQKTLTQVLSLSPADRSQLLGILIRHTLETGELEASTLRTQIAIIEVGR
jgi:hypothetical protein